MRKLIPLHISNFHKQLSSTLSISMSRPGTLIKLRRLLLHAKKEKISLNNYLKSSVSPEFNRILRIPYIPIGLAVKRSYSPNMNEKDLANARIMIDVFIQHGSDLTIEYNDITFDESTNKWYILCNKKLSLLDSILKESKGDSKRKKIPDSQKQFITQHLTQFSKIYTNAVFHEAIIKSRAICVRDLIELSELEFNDNPFPNQINPFQAVADPLAVVNNQSALELALSTLQVRLTEKPSNEEDKTKLKQTQTAASDIAQRLLKKLIPKEAIGTLQEVAKTAEAFDHISTFKNSSFASKLFLQSISIQQWPDENIVLFYEALSETAKDTFLQYGTNDAIKACLHSYSDHKSSSKVVVISDIDADSLETTTEDSKSHERPSLEEIDTSKSQSSSEKSSFIERCLVQSLKRSDKQLFRYILATYPSLENPTLKPRLIKTANDLNDPTLTYYLHRFGIEFDTKSNRFS